MTVLGDVDDPRAVAVVEAVDHWNQELARLDASLPFGRITWSEQRLPEEDLRALSEAVVARRRMQPGADWTVFGATSSSPSLALP